MTARTFRATIAGLIAIVVLVILVGTFAGDSTAAPQGAAWRTFDQHAVETALQVARGNFLDTKGRTIFGRNPDVDASTTETVWNTGGDYVFPAAAETLSIVSTDAADDGTPGGTGARTISVTGLDVNFEEISEIVTLDGLTPVVTTAAFLRVNLGVAITAGSAGSNVGDIVATQSTSALTMFTMSATLGRTQLGVYTVPADHTLLVTRVFASISRTQAGTAAVLALIRFPSIPDSAFQEFGGSGVHSSGTSWVSVTYPLPTNFPGPLDVILRAEAGSNNTDINAGFEGFLIDNR